MVELTINNFRVSADIIAYRMDRRIIFMSLIGHNSVINAINSSIKKGVEAHSYNTYTFFEKKCYSIDKYKDDKSGLVHEIIYYNNQDRSPDSDEIMFDFMYTNEQNKKDQLFSYLNKYTNIPLLPEWKDYIHENLWQYCTNNTVTYDRTMYSSRPIQSCHYYVKQNVIYDIISRGLRENNITINNSETSTTINQIVGLDSYLNTFSDVLADKIKSSFVPQFIPGENSFDQKINDFDDVCFDQGTKLFYAQKCTMQSVVNALRKKKASFVIGEQGSGKTLMSLGICYGHAKRDGFNAFVMCPSHLVNKWQREIEKYMPNGKAYIVKNISDIRNIEHIIRDKNKTENTFVIVSKENAKLDMEYRPAAVWSRVHKKYLCPHCGHELLKPQTQQQRRHYIHEPIQDEDLRKELSCNEICTHDITRWNHSTEQYITDRKCNTKLWVPVSDNNDGWIKLGSAGWFHKDRIQAQFEMLSEKKTKTKQECSILSTLSDYINGDQKFTQPTYSRYPLAKYIHKYFKGFIDYAIGDELHLYNGDSAQGEAFGYFADVADKVIGLTGTLLNGYADGLFYTLFRTMPDVLKAEGFQYGQKEAFSRTYGVVKNVFSNDSNQSLNNNIRNTTITKRLPGISPIVFTKFLIENAVFVNLSDMLDGLPNYKEIPLGIDMDKDLAEKYNKLQNDFVDNVRGFQGFSIAGAMTKTLSAYLDMPYDNDPVCDPKSGKIIITPPDVEDSLMVRPKEQQLIDIVKKKHRNGEKVLVYYHWTNITNVDERIPMLLEEQGLKCAVLKASVNAQKREEWIREKVEKDNIDVLICNPTLVETGLDLLDFTTIIFYEVGYNLYTMRQSSRRSWRLGQTRPISVYYLYYNDTIQEQALSLMATKLQASMAIEGKFSEDGLNALSNNEDLLTQIANNIVNGIKHKVNSTCFASINTESYHTEEKIEEDYGFDQLFDDINDLGSDTEKDNEIIQHIMTEPKRYFRKTKYQVEGKTYKHEFWKQSNNSIGSIINNNNQLCDLFVGVS